MKISKLLLWCVGGFVVVVAIMFFALNIGMDEVKKLTISDVDLSRIADGIYLGSYHKGRWTYDVQVTVKDHAITTAKNTNKRMAVMKDFNEKIEAAIIKKQSPQVDVVSGATVNTKAMSKAVETALTSAIK